MHSMQPELAADPECLRAISEWLRAINSVQTFPVHLLPKLYVSPHTKPLSPLLGRPTAGT